MEFWTNYSLELRDRKLVHCPLNSATLVHGYVYISSDSLQLYQLMQYCVIKDLQNDTILAVNVVKVCHAHIHITHTNAKLQQWRQLSPNTQTNRLVSELCKGRAWAYNSELIQRDFMETSNARSALVSGSINMAFERMSPESSIGHCGCRIFCKNCDMFKECWIFN